MDDLLISLQHDHARLIDGLHGLRSQLAQAPSPDRRRELLRAAEHLQDALLEHFGEEEEALFPFVREKLPALAAQVDDLAGGHDAVCGAIARVLHLARRSDLTPAEVFERAPEAVERLEDAYQQHSEREMALLDDAGRRLGDDERRGLAEAARGLTGARRR